MSFSPQSVISLVLLGVVLFGLFLWWRAEPRDPAPPSPRSDRYTADNVFGGGRYHLEQDGEIQDFEVLSVHASGFFLVRVDRPEGHELDRDWLTIEGWTREIRMGQHIRKQDLQAELPDELRYAPRYN